MPIRVEIVSQDRIVFQGKVDMALLPGAEGEMGILPNHSPLLTLLKYGIITLKAKGESDQHFTVAGGVAEVQPDQVTVLADSAENVEEIDTQRAEAAKDRAEQMLKAGIKPDTDEYMALRAALIRSNMRLNAAQRYRGQRR